MARDGKEPGNPYADIANQLNDDLKELIRKKEELIRKKEEERLEEIRVKEIKRQLEKKRLERENELAILKAEQNAKDLEKLKIEKKTKIKVEFTDLCYEAITSFDMSKIGETQHVTFKTKLFQEISGFAKKEIAFIEDLRQRLEREGAKSSEVQVSLMWNNYNDLDLHVVCPSGERIHGGNRESACGGELDVDANIRPETKRPVENIVWPQGKAQGGTYKAFVHHYKKHKVRVSRDPTNFKVVCNAGGDIKHYEGTVSYGDPILLVCEFTILDPETRLERARLKAVDAVRNRDSSTLGSPMAYQIFDEVFKETQVSLAEFGYDLSTGDACNFKIQKEIKPF